MRTSARENWRRVSLVMPNIAAPFLRFSCSAHVCRKLRRKENASKWPLPEGLKVRHLAAGCRSRPSSRLLNAQHFADDEAWRRCDEHCTSVLYEWRFKCKSRLAGTCESRIRHASYSGEGIQGANRFGTYEFCDDHCLGGYWWFAGGCIRLGCRYVDHGESSGPPRLVGKADCATGGAVFRLPWRKRALAGRRHAAQLR